MALQINARDVAGYLSFLGFAPSLDPGEHAYLVLAGAELEDTGMGSPAFAPATATEHEPLVVDLTKARPDYYDDLCLTLTEGGNSPDTISANRCTVDPGAYHNHAQGRATLVWGHPHRFIKGQHYGNKKSVLRPKDGKNRYWRDADYDFEHDPGEGVKTGNGTLLIHAMGGKKIQRWGAGCMGIWAPKNYSDPLWRSWRKDAYATCKTSGSIQVVIMPASDFARWKRSKNAHKPTLWPGATGRWVQKLQTQLNAAAALIGAASIKVDGDFGNATTQALLGFQKTVMLTADAVAGPLTWAQLKRYS